MYKPQENSNMNSVANETFRPPDIIIHPSTNNELKTFQQPTRSNLDMMDKRKMWYSTKTGTSLLDEEDEEYCMLDSSVGRLPEDENSSISSSNQINDPKLNSISVVSQDYDDDDNVGPGSHLVRLSENMSDMATFLCPIDFIANTNDVSPSLQHQSYVQNPLHERQLSETDSLQRLASSGPCGRGNSLFPSLRTSDSQETDIAPCHEVTMLDSSAACSDIDLLGMRRLIVTDILTLLSSPHEESWVSSMQRWLKDEPATKFQTIKRKECQNRCSHSKANSRRIRELWFRWHGHNSDSNLGMGINVECSVTNNGSATKSFDDTGVFSHAAPPVDVIDYFYDSDPETFSSIKRTTGLVNQPCLIITDASFGSTGHGEVPSTPKASNRNRCPSFDTRSAPSNRSFDCDDFAVGLSDNVQNFDLWDDQVVKNFVQVSLESKSSRSNDLPSHTHKFIHFTAFNFRSAAESRLAS
jgi:hypothetical protein